jgi:anti-anti-sigma factor
VIEPTTGGAIVVALPAEIDITTCGDACAELMKAVARPGDLVIADMTATTFCDSSGIRVLLAAHDHAAAGGGALRVAVTPGSTVFRAMAVMGVDRVLAICDSPNGGGQQPGGAAGCGPT